MVTKRKKNNNNSQVLPVNGILLYGPLRNETPSGLSLAVSNSYFVKQFVHACYCAFIGVCMNLRILESTRESRNASATILWSKFRPENLTEPTIFVSGIA